MSVRLQLGELVVDVVRKDIKNVHLSVHPPTGRVTIAAPARLSLDTIRVFAISRIGWIRQQQKKLHGQEREPRREYLERESHFVWGRRYLLRLAETDRPPAVELSHSRLVLHTRPRWTDARKRALLDAWYREQVKLAVPPLSAKWERLMGVSVTRFFVQRMKTKWGSCNHHAQTIRLNTELAKKPRACLEYVVVHEMVHLLEPTHNERFLAHMDLFLPAWRHRREELNAAPLAHEDWTL